MLCDQTAKVGHELRRKTKSAVGGGGVEAAL